MKSLTIPNLLKDLYEYLPEENILSENVLVDALESVITEVGREDENYSEVLCKGLRAAGLMNKAKSAIAIGTIKRERSRHREVEFFNKSSDELWDAFNSSLADLCPLLPGGGYSFAGKKSFGFYANGGDPVEVPRHKCTNRDRRFSNISTSRLARNPRTRRR